MKEKQVELFPDESSGPKCPYCGVTLKDGAYSKHLEKSESCLQESMKAVNNILKFITFRSGPKERKEEK